MRGCADPIGATGKTPGRRCAALQPGRRTLRRALPAKAIGIEFRIVLRVVSEPAGAPVVPPRPAVAGDAVDDLERIACRKPHHDEAVEIANSTDYGLAGAVWSADKDHAIAVAKRLRTGQVDVNGGGFNPSAPFGGYKQSGIGRERGRYGFEEFLEVKSLQL